MATEAGSYEVRPGPGAGVEGRERMQNEGLWADLAPEPWRGGGWPPLACGSQ